MSMQTLDQRRAAHAWAAVRTFAGDHINLQNGKRIRDEKAKKYGTQVRKLPTRIMNSGLGQALAFLLAKDECPDLIRAINHWVLFKQDYPRDIASLPRPNLLLERVINGTSDELRWMTAEALSYLQWLVRFAEAEGLTDNSGD